MKPIAQLSRFNRYLRVSALIAAFLAIPVHAGMNYRSSPEDKISWMRDELNVSDTEISAYINAKTKLAESEREYSIKLNSLIKQNRMKQITSEENAEISNNIRVLTEEYSDSQRIYKDIIDSEIIKIYDIQRKILLAGGSLSMIDGEVLNDSDVRTRRAINRQAAIDSFVISRLPSPAGFALSACKILVKRFAGVFVVVCCIAILFRKRTDRIRNRSFRFLFSLCLAASAVIVFLGYVPWSIPYHIYAFLGAKDEASLLKYEKELRRYGFDTIIIHTHNLKECPIYLSSGQIIANAPLGLIRPYLSFIAKSSTFEESLGVIIDEQFISFKELAKRKKNYPISIASVILSGNEFSPDHLIYSKSQSINYYLSSNTEEVVASTEKRR